ncbi:hypothetical protein D9611_004486 [Ephemerocybe angulata]|uniref:SEC7 domain-containing protein n=1 Tax=Ephemerocybe angulata TaxID=980116 RepID=A0A8H5BK03_9AGAR|nr:hypothetical protein D9611_004486 [Tulosesus angulatus]
MILDVLADVLASAFWSPNIPMSSSSPTVVGHRRPATIKYVLYAEILAVTSAMRKNSRWASSTVVVGTRDPRTLGTNLGLRISSPANVASLSGRGSKEAELMTNFIELKRSIQGLQDLKDVDLNYLLAPFFAILRSPLSTGPITSAALSSLHTFFVCGLISPDSFGLDTALAELSSTISHCKFEASDSSGDEVVLLKIMTVIQDCLCGSVGSRLGDIEVCEMLETVLTTCCQMRLSEILRRSAENTMHALVRKVFSRLHELDPEEEEAKLIVPEADSEPELKMSVVPVEPSKTPQSTAEEGEQEPEKEKGQDGDMDTPESTPQPEAEPEAEPEKPPSEDDIPSPSAVSASALKRPEYGLPSILELLRVLVNVLDPNDQQHTDSTRLIALAILNAAFEEAGPVIAMFPSLRALIVDPGCKYLFQLARSENTSILHLSLRTISTILDCIGKHLRLQQELFLAFTIDRLSLPPAKLNVGKKGGLNASPRPGTPSLDTPPLGPIDERPENAPLATRVTVPPARGETRELILETLSHICNHPNFMVNVYTNYDCDINCENLFERLIDFLTKAVYPAQGIPNPESQRNTQYLSLEILLAFVNEMAARLDATPPAWPSEYPQIDSLLAAKSQKQLILTGASLFNFKPKSGLAFLEENGLIYKDLAPGESKELSLAKFLKTCTRLDKRLLGDFISRPDQLEVLKEFIGLFDFKGKDIAEAMRLLLEAFRLPGEAQQIARITETFAAVYFASGPEEIKSEDAVYVLAYSVIMLNTDQHNPQVRKRMAVEDYQKNLRGVNDGTDFSPEFVKTIFDSIRKREIILPEEHAGQAGFEFAWKELLARSRQAGDFLECQTPAFDVEMFKTVWKPVITAIAYAFITFEDDYIIQRAIAGFRQCATLAGRFNLPDVFDFVVISLSQATGLLSESLPSVIPNYPVVEVEGQSVTVSRLSVEFGTNFKGQLAAVVLFNIVNGNGNALREGWTQIFEMFQNLFLHTLLPSRMLQMQDFLGGVVTIPMRGSQPQQVQAPSQGGLLSALSSYLMTPYSNEPQVPDATDADVENTLCSIDCITSCRLDELYSQIVQLEPEAIVAAVRALEALAHERAIAKLKLQTEDNLTSLDDPPPKLPYDPASVFLLETMINIATQAPQYIEEIWPIVFEHLSALLSSSTQYSDLLIERAVVSLLRVCRLLAQTPALRDQLYVSFDLLARMDPSVASSIGIGEQIISGLILIMKEHKDIIKSPTEWNLVFALIRTTLSQAEAAKMSFDLISTLTAEGPDMQVTLDNFAGLVNVLDDFATAAGTVTEAHQQRRRKVEPLTAANSPAVERGSRSIDLLSGLYKRLPALLEGSQVSHSHVWKQLVLPLLTSLGHQSTNASREVRHSAIGQLQRILLGPSLTSEDTVQNQVEDIFNRVVFKLVDELLKPQVYQRDPQGIPETRLRASALLCKSFMHLELRESQKRPDFRLLWIQILDLMDRLMNIDKNDQLYEAVPESLKNVLLVMNAAGILVPPPADGSGEEQDEVQKTLWTATHERMERFLPRFLTSIIPPSQPLSP